LPFHKIDVERIGSRYKKGVFHPKVFLLQNDKYETYLITGSANLTLSGFGRNIEGIAIKKVEDIQNAKEIVKFFSKIFETSVFDDAIDIDKWSQEWLRSLKQEKTNWHFHSCFSERSFLDTFFKGKEREAFIWSPYFGEITNIVETIRDKNPELTVGLIPDAVSNKKVRITKESASLDSGNVNFYRDLKIEKDDSLVHAKLWLTKELLAIGSWNFTEAATGISLINANNIEAGIVQEIDKQTYRQLTEELKPFKNIEFMEENEIEDDKPEASKSDFYCDVIVDWKKKIYKTVNCSEKLANKESITIHLPGIPEASFETDSTMKFTLDSRKLIKDKFFNLKESGNVIYTGTITEIGLQNRPVWEYENLDDLLFALYEVECGVDDSDCKTVHEKLLSTSTAATEHDLESDIENQPSWFVMFQAMKNLKDLLKKADDKERQKLLFSRPGSLEELAGKSLEIVKMEKVSLVLSGFLLQELLSISKAHSDAKLILKNIESISKGINEKIKDNDNNKIFIEEIITKECGYE